ncbi:MAG: hypothetical protein AAGE05_03130 [Pseudomonadota bacterium]
MMDMKPIWSGLAVSALLIMPVTGANGADNRASANAQKLLDRNDGLPITVPPPPAGMSQIVFYRQGGGGPLVRCRIREGETMIGRLNSGAYFAHVVEPGPYQYSVRTEATDVLNVEAEPDETQYIRCTIRMGLFVGRPNLSPSTEEEFTRRSHRMVWRDRQEDEGRVDPPWIRGEDTQTDIGAEAATEVTAGESAINDTDEIPTVEIEPSGEQPDSADQEFGEDGSAILVEDDPDR